MSCSWCRCSPTPRTFVHQPLNRDHPCSLLRSSSFLAPGIPFPQGILHPPLGILSHFPLSLHIFLELAVWALGHGLCLGILPYISRNTQSQFFPFPQPQACLCSFPQVTAGNFRYSKCPSDPSYPSFFSGLSFALLSSRSHRTCLSCSNKQKSGVWCFEK